MLTLLLLPACELVEPFLYEVRTDPEEVSLSGYLYNGPYPDAEDPVITGSEAAVTALDPADGVTVIAEGEEPYPDTYPGYWSLTFAPEQEFLLRIEGGPEHYPALWAGRAPPGNGLFPSTAEVGAQQRAGVFGWPMELVDGLFAEIAASEGVDLQDLAEGEICHLWGGPFDPEAVRGDQLAVEGGDGEPATVFAYTLDADSGALVRTTAGPVYYFFAFNLAPGEVWVELDGEASTAYIAEGGDLISPWFFQGSP